MIKLYVVFNVLEIFDKLCASFGQDLLEILYAAIRRQRRWRGGGAWVVSIASAYVPARWSSHHAHASLSVSIPSQYSLPPPPCHLTLSPPPSPILLSTPSGLLLDFLIVLLYITLHTAVLFYHAVALNVAINSHNNILITLLISNNFVELKSNVFKKCEKENLFQVSCADIVERFQLSVYLAITGGSLSSGPGLGWFAARSPPSRPHIAPRVLPPVPSPRIPFPYPPPSLPISAPLFTQVCSSFASTNWTCLTGGLTRPIITNWRNYWSPSS